MNDYKLIIAKNITKLRKAVPITQAELAEKLDYSEKAVSKWERGESLPDVATLKAIADTFGVTVDYLLEETHEDEKSKGVPRQLRTNRILVAGMSCMLAILIATVVFVALWLSTDIKDCWLVLTYSVPACAIILIVFNSIWGETKYHFIFISLLLWSALACIYLTIGNWSYWPLFFIGIPGQAIILMWSGIKAKFFKITKKSRI